jgi:E3 SUMO-protein ligase PIAS1
MLTRRFLPDIEQAQNSGRMEILDMARKELGLNNYTPAPSYPSPYSNATPAQSASPQFSSPANRYGPQTGGYGSAKAGPYQISGTVRFGNSPFYQILRPLSQQQELKARETTRDAARVSVVLPQDVADQIQKNTRYRVMVFCTSDPASYKASDIAFPHQVELKCNGEDVKANLRGLKNKPGSTRPADITHLLRKKQLGYRNEVEMVYALTNKVCPFDKYCVLTCLPLLSYCVSDI